MNKKPLPPCPGVYLEENTVSGTFFKDEVGKDITDKVLEVEIKGYDGYCTYSKDLKKVEVRINAVFDAVLGGAAKSRKVDFSYFIAVPSFYPAKEGKQVFNVSLDFPEGVYYLSHLDDEIKITLPVPQDEKDKDLSIFLGLQLTENQLKYNREKLKEKD
ncbi:MAG: hypothetical protein AB7U85_08415 [Alphaproteobacteria bacterium]